MNHATLTKQFHQRIEKFLAHYLETTTCGASALITAMQYAVLAKSKRLRPILVYLTGYIFDAPLESLDAPATAIELIHTYSLIHDDLPAMDNADLRRGKPTCHLAFNESTAILAGDALQPLAFEILTNHPSSLSDTQRLKMIATLSRVSGIAGMAAGQMLDLTGPTNLDELLVMYTLKTGALLSASIELGAIAAGVSVEPLLYFAECLGLAFQIQDDLLDIQSHSLTLGKTTGIDERNNKITYPGLVGIEASQQKIRELIDSGCNTLSCIGEKTQLLCEFARSLVERNS